MSEGGGFEAFIALKILPINTSFETDSFTINKKIPPF